MNIESWREFQDTGLLWFINTILHVFGWAIVVGVNIDDGSSCAFPARVPYCGFPEEANDRGYKRIREYMAKNGADLLSDVEVLDPPGDDAPNAPND